MKNGDFVKIDYVGKLETGEIFDLTDEETAKKEGVYSKNVRYAPVTVIVGEGFMIKGIEEALLKMEIGDSKDIELSPEESFGNRDSRLVRTVPEKAFQRQKVAPRPGMIVDFSGFKGRIQSISPGRVRVDFNNPMAGKRVKYHIELKEKIEKSEDKADALLEFFGVSGKAEINGNEIRISASPRKEIKERITGLVHKYFEGIEKITFFETYPKPAEQKNEE